VKKNFYIPFIVMLFVAVMLAPAWGLTAEPNSMDPHYHNLTPNNMIDGHLHVGVYHHFQKAW
jgi:hypothetical protein